MCGGSETTATVQDTTTTTVLETTTTTVPDIIDFDKLFFEDYFAVRWNKENITWRFAEGQLITAYSEKEYSLIKPSGKSITYTKKAFQVWDDAVNSINFKQSENSDNADITIGIVDNIPGRNFGFWESVWNENNEITYSTIIIEDNLDDQILNEERLKFETRWVYFNKLRTGIGFIVTLLYLLVLIIR